MVLPVMIKIVIMNRADYEFGYDYVHVYILSKFTTHQHHHLIAI